MLTLTFLGVGGAFAKRNYNSNALVEAWSVGPGKQDAPDDTLLIDFGTTGSLALHALKSAPGFTYLDCSGLVNYPALRRIFISHQHGDHIGGLEELAAMNAYKYLDPETGTWFQPELISSGEILANLWDHSLRGGLSVVHGRYALLQDFFRTHAVSPTCGGGQGSFTMLDDRYEFTLIPTDHVHLLHKYDWPSFGLLITDARSQATVVHSGDTRFDPDGLGALMATAKLNFHEVQLEESPGSVHTLLSELRTLPEPTRKKTLLYHYDDTWDEGTYDFVAKEFAGFAKPRHRYVLFA